MSTVPDACLSLQNGQQIFYVGFDRCTVRERCKTTAQRLLGDGRGFLATPVAPTVTPDRAHVQLHGTLSVNAGHGVLANDTDPIPNDALIVSAVDGQAANVGHAVAGTYERWSSTRMAATPTRPMARMLFLRAASAKISSSINQFISRSIFC
jgi:hypothetical protein